MEEETNIIKEEKPNSVQPEAEKKDDGFVPIPVGEQPTPNEKQAQRPSGFRRDPRGASRSGYHGRAGVGRDRQKDEFQTKLLDLARVTRVTGGGKRMSFRAVVAAGDKKGKVGIGIDKGKDVSQAVEKATRRAKRDMLSVVIVDETIPHEVKAKYGPAVILLKPQKKGRGLVAGGAVRTICDLAGIKSISSKILSGSKNKLNNARATIEALRKLKAKSS